jgi:lipopolysaccharide/colanic/teichoic acid biosynthesis glycosyltransferase
MSLGETEFEADASLDELLQVFNVLKYEQSLVGPCPRRVQHDPE